MHYLIGFMIFSTIAQVSNVKGQRAERAPVSA